MSSHDHSPEVHVLHPVGGRQLDRPAHGVSLGFGGDDKHGHDSIEAFPRLAVRNMIGGTLAAARRRELLQDGVLTLGLAFLALALPTERLLGDGPALVLATDRGTWFSAPLALQPLAQLLSRMPSIGAERAWFLIAALCWAASYPVLSRMNLALGMSRLASSAGALLVLVSPLAFLSATLPGPSGPALLGSAILFSSLITSASRGAEAKRSLGPIATWFAVCLVDPNLVLLLPAVVWNGFSPQDGRPSSRPVRWRTILGAMTAVLALGALLMAAASADPAGSQVTSMWRGVGLKLLGTGSAGAPDSLTFLFILAPAIGVGVLGLAELLRRPAEPTESAPPAWILAFVGVPMCVKLLGGTPNLDTGAWVLSPLIAVGLASLLTRSQEGRRWGLILALSAAQLALTYAFIITVDLGDPSRPWTASEAGMLKPGDLVMTRDQQHDYLLRHRLQLRTINLRVPVELDEKDRADWWARARESVRAQAQAGGRVLVDWKMGEPVGGGRGYVFQQQLHELVLLAPVTHLDPRGKPHDDLREEDSLPPAKDGR